VIPDTCASLPWRACRLQEWADLIRYLQRLQRVLTKYSQLPVIPDKILVAKRLFQCLNSSLPSGTAQPSGAAGGATQPPCPPSPHVRASRHRTHRPLPAYRRAGVHLTTLQTYELIFSRIGSARLARDLAFYTEGIFTLYRHAAYQV
jgi:hypothetical protein